MDNDAKPLHSRVDRNALAQREESAMVRVEKIPSLTSETIPRASVARPASPGPRPRGPSIELAAKAIGRVKDHKLNEHLSGSDSGLPVKGLKHPRDKGASTNSGVLLKQSPKTGWKVAESKNPHRPIRHGSAWATAGPTTRGGAPLFGSLAGRLPAQAGGGIWSASDPTRPWGVWSKRPGARWEDVSLDDEIVFSMDLWPAFERTARTLKDAVEGGNTGAILRAINDFTQAYHAMQDFLRKRGFLFWLGAKWPGGPAGSEGLDTFGDVDPITGAPIRLLSQLSAWHPGDADAPWWHPRRGGASPIDPVTSLGGFRAQILNLPRKLRGGVVGSATAGHDVVDPDPNAPSAGGARSYPVLPKGFGWIDPPGSRDDV